MRKREEIKGEEIGEEEWRREGRDVKERRGKTRRGGRKGRNERRYSFTARGHCKFVAKCILKVKPP